MSCSPRAPSRKELPLRVVADGDDVRVAMWKRDALESATADCPWVADELRRLADRYQALAGATMGPLGERLDETLRDMVTSRLDVRVLAPGEQLIAKGDPVPGASSRGCGAT